MSAWQRRPFVFIGFSFTLGILWSDSFRPPFGPLGLSAVSAFVLYTLFSLRRRWAGLLLLLLFFLLGALRFQAHDTLHQDDISRSAKYYRAKPVEIRGRVVSEVRPGRALKGTKTSFTLKVLAVKTARGWKEKRGTVLVNIYRAEEIGYGDVLVLSGRLHRPFEFSKDKMTPAASSSSHSPIALITVPTRPSWSPTTRACWPWSPRRSPRCGVS